MRRKIFSIILGVLMVGVMSLTPRAAFAACDSTFLGLKPWYDGLCEGDEIKDLTGAGETGLRSFVWRVVMNVIFDLTLVIGYIAVAMVIYGGYQYIWAQGDPSKVAKGKKTLTAAVIGTVIALAASVIVNTAIEVLGIDTGAGWQQGEFTADKIQNIFNWVYVAAGIVAVVFIIKSGADYMLSQGDPGKTKKATNSLIFAAVGLIIVFLAAAITSFVIEAAQGAM